MPMIRYKPEQIVTLSCGKLKWPSPTEKDHPTSLQRSRDHRPDVLPLEEGIRRFEDGSGETTQRTGERKRQAQAAGGGAVAGEANSEGRGRGKLLSPERRRGAVRHARESYRVSGAACLRRAAGAVERNATLRRNRSYRRGCFDASDHRIGQRVRSLWLPLGSRSKLREAGWPVGKDRVQRIWQREGLKVPQKQRPRGRLWFNDGSCVRLRPERANHVCGATIS